MREIDNFKSIKSYNEAYSETIQNLIQDNYKEFFITTTFKRKISYGKAKFEFKIFHKRIQRRLLGRNYNKKKQFQICSFTWLENHSKKKLHKIPIYELNMFHFHSIFCVHKTTLAKFEEMIENNELDYIWCKKCNRDKNHDECYVSNEKNTSNKSLENLTDYCSAELKVLFGAEFERYNNEFPLIL